jgi:hypothetical protein
MTSLERIEDRLFKRLGVHGLRSPLCVSEPVRFRACTIRAWSGPEPGLDHGQAAFLHCEPNFTASYPVSRLRSAISNQSKVVVNAAKTRCCRIGCVSRLPHRSDSETTAPGKKGKLP